MSLKVSVVMPTFNRAHLISDAIRSIQAQQLRDWELIVIDDGSTDETAQVVSALQRQDSRIQYQYQRNQGPGAARNHGIRLARGSHVAFLDSDDQYLQGGLDMLWNAAAADPVKKLLYGDYVIRNMASDEVQPVRARPPARRPDLYLQFLIPRANPILPSACIVEREVLLATGPIDVSFQTGQMVELWSRFVLRNDIHRLGVPTTAYLKHSGQVSNNIPLRRLNYDRIATRVFSSLPVSEWLPNATRPALAAKLDVLAKLVLGHRFSLVDTALLILKAAQLQDFSSNRDNFIQTIETQADAHLKKQYGVLLRMNQELSSGS